MEQVAQTTAIDIAPARVRAQRLLMLGALGVVYGDIGTSPLYTIKQCVIALTGREASSVSPPALYGILSLLTWALTIVVTVKYVMVIMRADNRGEGGILALTALALRAAEHNARLRWWILAAGILGAALFYGDGVITPAISLLGAIEGLKVATPLLDPYVIPICVVLLLLLFLFQHRGTRVVGATFGPVMILWFTTIGVLGLVEIVRQPAILKSLDPYYGIALLATHPAGGVALLGAVVLVFTGVETLYADMGHFGRRPIRVDWIGFVFPALLLNYFGQGALLLQTPEAIDNPFYRLAPDWGLYPLVMLSAVATVIASQAVISGAFSMTRQAVLLGYLPRFDIRHTSESEIGQIYVPKINLFLLIATVGLVLGFKRSDNLGAAYGVAVTGTMALTTVLALVYTTAVAGWNKIGAGILFGGFLVIDLCFFGANLLKIVEGGWFPLVVGGTLFALMLTWMSGRERVLKERWREALPLETFLRTLHPDRPARVPGTAVFMVPNADIVPPALLHNLKHNKVLHERVVLMRVVTEDIPHVPDSERIDIAHLQYNFHAVTVHYGFMDEPNIPRTLAQLRVMRFHFNLLDTSFFVGREKVVIGKYSRFWDWRKRLFILMHRTMLPATEYFRIPSNRVVELGGQVEI